MAWVSFDLPDSPTARIDLIRAGLPAVAAKAMLTQFDVPIGKLLAALALPVATFNRKVAKGETLAPDESERVLGLAAMVGQVQRMVEESGNPEGFDAAAWLSDWLQRRVPAFGRVQPLTYLDTMEGQGVVRQILARMQTGAYS